MNRRAFTQSLAALFAAPALPPVTLAAASAPLHPYAHVWADYLTRMHNICTPQMLAPFLQTDAAGAQLAHDQLVAQQVLTKSGAAHPKLAAKQPKHAPRQAQSQQAKSTTENKGRQSMPDEPAAQTTRTATPADLPALAKIWYDSWHQSHAAHVPAELVALRTEQDFHRRLQSMETDIITIGPDGAPLGFCALRDGEIYQLFVASTAQGTGAAAKLMRAAENTLIAQGITQTRFDCLPENHRARAFYRKMGWTEGAVETAYVDTSAGKFALDCIVFHKTLGAPA